MQINVCFNNIHARKEKKIEEKKELNRTKLLE